MNLRNKKTGKLYEWCSIMVKKNRKSVKLLVAEKEDDDREIYYYESFEKMCEDWETVEDPQPKEPLIKDKKVRKFVRDWAEHWKIDEVVIRFIDSNRIDLIGFPSPSSTKTGREIDIQRTVVRNEIIYGNRYTINELCGEDEE